MYNKELLLTEYKERTKKIKEELVKVSSELLTKQNLLKSIKEEIVTNSEFLTRQNLLKSIEEEINEKNSEIMDLRTSIELAAFQDNAYIVEKKFNGFHVTVHKKDDEVKIFSEQKKDLTIAFPTLVAEINKLSHFDFILDGELVPYKDGKTLGRNELLKFVGAVKSGKKLDDSYIKLHIWDAPYIGKNITNLSLSNRLIVLSKLSFSDRITETPRRIAKNPDSLVKYINWATELPGSEGAIIKDLNSSYNPGESSDWIKYRKLTSIDVRILKKVPKEKGLFNYLVGIEVPIKNDLKQDKIQKVGSQSYLVLGHTFNTSQEVEEGKVISIDIEEVWRHETDKGTYYSIHKPRFGFVKNQIKTSTIKDLEDIVTSVGVAIKEQSESIEYDENDYYKLCEYSLQRKDEGKEISGIQNFPDRMQEAFRKTKGKWNPYVIQWHLRGQKSIHSDIRLKVNDHLEGFTLFTPPSVDKPDLLDENPKNVRGTIKLPQPVEWLHIEGRIERGEPGTTEEYPAYFATVGKGNYRVLEITDHKIVFEFRSDTGKVKKPEVRKGEEYVQAMINKLPSELKQLNGCFSYHIAHIENRWIFLFDKLEKCPKEEEQEKLATSS